jgi:hypothetical protein
MESYGSDVPNRIPHSSAKHLSTDGSLLPHQFDIVITITELKNTNIINIEVLNAASHAAAI